MEPFLIFIVIVVIAIFFRLIAGGIDNDRVGDYISQRGGRLIEKHWAPFGRGWFGEKNDRIYEVTYIDAQGNTHQAICKTSMFSGVYFTEDRIIKTAHAPDNTDQCEQYDNAEDNEKQSLMQENRHLKEALERLKRQNDPYRE